MTKFFLTLIPFFLFSLLTTFSQTLPPNMTQRLLSFCELYSTVKYYYPDPNLRDFPWDAFAYQGYEIAKTSKNDKEFIQGIDSLFRIIVPGVQISKQVFNMAHITPEDTSLYPIRAFWQHQGGLNIEKPSFSKTSTLNYIFKKPIYNYYMNHSLPSKKFQGKTMRISLWAKVEEQKDSVEILGYKFANRKQTENRYITIKAAGNEWKRYEKEFTHIDKDAFPFDIIFIFHPKKGTVYVDNLKLEVKNEERWEETEIPNSNFEGYSSSGKLGVWESMYPLVSLVIADSINAIEGKYCLKLPSVQDKISYPPLPINQPYMVSLPMGYKGYIPLQLYANEKNVFPVSDKQTIKNLTKTFNRNALNANQQAIACAMQTWAALYHDYSYREKDFENKLNRLLFQTVRKLDTTKATNFYTILASDFLMWINDPHLRLEGKFSAGDTIEKKKINIPVKYPDATCLTETQWIITNVMDNVKTLQAGDVILQINNIKIDSLLQLYKAHNISRKIQHRVLERLLTTSEEPELKVQLLRNGKTVDVVFSADTRQKGGIISDKEKSKIYQTLQDSLKKTNALFYLNSLYPPEAFNRSIARDTSIILRQYRTTDSLITELNQHRALILDVRGRPSSSILHFFNECMGIELNKNVDIIKTAFYPVAQFKRDTLNYISANERKDVLIRVPVYVLIDYNTISAPEHSLLNLKASGKATFIGSNTAGAAGVVCKTKITNNITLVYTTGQMVGLDDNPMSYQGTGIAPDIYVYPTPQGIAEGRDEVLEKAIEVALKKE